MSENVKFSQVGGMIEIATTSTRNSNSDTGGTYHHTEFQYIDPLAIIRLSYRDEVIDCTMARKIDRDSNTFCVRVEKARYRDFAKLVATMKGLNLEPGAEKNAVVGTHTAAIR